ncbi:MAG: hypothetical protein ACOZCO_10100 [Bacteroidota bacterium]
MTVKRFVISVLVSALIMFILSFSWHGLILNDFKKISLDFNLFIVLAAIAYIAIGAALNFVMYYLETGDNLFGKPLLAGAALGFFIYLVVFVMGLSYHVRGLEHIVIDFGWQMVEQALGGVTVAFCYRVYHRMDAVSDDQ